MTLPNSRQLQLALRGRSSWGGRRPGAGRKPGPRPQVRHARRAHFRRLPSHVTLRIRPGLPSLRTVAIVRAIEHSFADACARPGFRLAQYSLHGNHVHLIVEAADRQTLGRGMKAIGARLARAVNRFASHHGPVLADRYHLRLLPTPREVHRALRYVLLNARRHAKRPRAALGRRLTLDPASSARWFEGWKRRGPSPPPSGSGPCPVAPPRTWLLRAGWRRHGLIDPADVPG